MRQENKGFSQILIVFAILVVIAVAYIALRDTTNTQPGQAINFSGLNFNP
jgi:hypothetical protein